MKKYIPLVLYLILYGSSFAQFPQINTSHKKEFYEHKERHYKKLLLSEQQKTKNQQDYDVKYYDLNLTPDPTTSVLSGTVKIVGEVVGQSLQHVELNFVDNMSVIAINWSNFQEKNLGYTHQDNILSIDLDSTLYVGEMFSLVVSYMGRPQDSGFRSFGFNIHNGEPMIWTLSEPFGARAWWPCKDVPSDKADSVDIHITVPENLIAVSNGTLVEKITANGKTTYHWHEKYPIVTYLVSLAIYPYKVFYDDYIYNDGADTMKIHFYVFPENYEPYKAENAQVKNMIACFADRFGEYPFIEEKYGQADFLGGGAMEHQTCSSFSFWGGWVYAHELAHQWWGDLITCESFHHIWLNEGFATYSEALWYEYLYGPGAVSFYQMNFNLYLGPGTVYVEDPMTQSIFHGGLSYNKGSWILHMLRHVVGDSVFFNILKAYYNSPELKYGTATTEDFQAVCEQVSDKDLSTFFHQWIYEEWFPQYTYYWLYDQLDDSTYKVFGSIIQEQTKGPIFEMPLDLTIKTEAGDTTIVFFDDEKTEYFEYIVNSRPVDVLLDKDNWVLKTVNKIETPLFTLLKYEIKDDNDNHAEVGETVQLIIEILNNGLEATNVHFELTTEDPDISIIDSTLDIPLIGMGQKFDNQQNPFIFSVNSVAEDHLAEFKLHCSANASYNNFFSLDIPIGYPHILVVDDDDGKNYERFIDDILVENRLMYDSWNVKTRGIPQLSNNYTTLIWSTGDDSTTALTPEEQNLLMDFIDRGGKLLLNGQNIGFDLIEEGSAEDSLFYNDYLHAKYINNSADDPWILGEAGDPIGNQLYVFLVGNYGGANNQVSTDVIEPLKPAVSFLYYAISKQSAGIYYEDSVSGARIVYLPFGLEGIAGPNPTSADKLIERIFNWFAGTTGIREEVQEFHFPQSYCLYDNYPNPFNPSTYIKFDLPEATKVTLRVYNVLGQEIITLINEQKPAGSFEVSWNGVDKLGNKVSNGIYFYKLETSKYSKTRKMLLLE